VRQVRVDAVRGVLRQLATVGYAVVVTACATDIAPLAPDATEKISSAFDLDESRRVVSISRRAANLPASCIVGGDDFFFDSVWSAASTTCAGGVFFNGSTFSSSFSDPTPSRADLVPVPGSGDSLFFVVTAVQYFGPERVWWVTHTLGSSVVLDPNAVSVALQSFALRCPSHKVHLGPEGCFNWARAIGQDLYYHDESHICINNPSSPFGACSGTALVLPPRCEEQSSALALGCPPPELSIEITLLNLEEETITGCGIARWRFFSCVVPPGCSVLVSVNYGNVPVGEVEFAVAVNDTPLHGAPRVISYGSQFPGGIFSATVAIENFGVVAAATEGFLPQTCNGG
jgi:hypothetical protein